MKIIAGSIDFSKVDKSKIVEGKNGAKYYNITIMLNDEKDKYGNDCSISEGQTKEEREAKKRKTFIGNAKIVWDSNPPAIPESESEPKSNDKSDDLPF